MGRSFSIRIQFGIRLLLYVLLPALLVPLDIDAASLPVYNKLAAEVTLGGKVTGGTNQEALPGVTILVVDGKGTKRGVTTNENGDFRISNLQSGQPYSLEFSYIGFEKKTVSNFVLNESNLNYDVVLNESSSKLDEVVVVGYGTATKRDVTGAVKSLKSSEFNAGIINSPEQLLQGKVSGVNVTSATGEPGGKTSITIRGPGGVRTGSTPLFVVDGMALDNSGTGGDTNPLNFINPQDIESMDVLKDASATAIYGARGANGVILITTKKGKSGQATVNYSGSFGLSTMARPLDVLSGPDFLTEGAKLGGSAIINGGANTDWQKVVSRTAQTHNHNVALSGGTPKMTYYGSFGIQKQEGILKGSNQDRYTGRINLSQKMLNDIVTLDVNLNASSVKQLRPNNQGLIGAAITANPTYKVYNDEGEPFQYEDGTNPLITLNLYKEVLTTNRVLASISPSVKIAKGLVYKLNFGIDNSTSTQNNQTKANLVPFSEGRLDAYMLKNTNRLIENYLTYNWSNPIHNFSILAGHSYQHVFLQSSNYSINKFPVSDIEPIYNPGLGQDLTLVNNRPGGWAIVNELQSFFSRANYSFKDKYLVTATLRVDGSSKFGENNKYGYFPSFSLGWRISEEPFMKNGPFSDLKLRAGWGSTGNQEIPSKITQARFTSAVSGTTSYPLDASTTYPAGTTYTRLANPNIQWEVSRQTDIGLDFALLKGALTGEIDYFNKVSEKILLEVIPSDPVQPAGTYWTNVPKMQIENQGVELDLNYRKIFESGLRFSLGGNITFIKNKVSNSPYSVIPSGSAQGSGLTSATINGYINGAAIGSFFLKEFTGFDEQGISTFRDVDGDGIITDKDRIVAGTALPSKIYSFNGSVSYKGFDLVANFNGVSGNKVYDNTANSNFYKLKLSKGVNVTREALASTQESINNSAPVSTRYLKDGSYLRLNSLILGYNLNTKALGIYKWVQTARVSVTGQNLFIATKYDGYDPEVNNDRQINGITSYGIDYLSYPKARTVIFGLNLGF